MNAPLKLPEGYRLFYDDHSNALQSAIDNNVHEYTFKQVAARMWPHLKPESAYARLKSCLSSAKDEKLDLAETVLLCRVCGRYEPLMWLCDELDHARPQRRAPQDKAAELITEFNRSIATVVGLAKQIENAGGADAISKLARGIPA